MLFTLYGFVIQQSQPNYYYIVCVSMSTIALYSIHRIVGINKVIRFENEGRFRIIKLYKKHIILYCILSSIMCLISFLYLPFNIQLILFFTGIICIGYAVPYNRGKRIRDIDYIKIILIAIFWTIYSIVIPSILSEKINATTVMYAISSVLFFLGLTLPFDIRDIAVDEHIQVKTFAILLGEKASVNMALILVSLSAIFIMTYSAFSEFNAVSLSWILVCLITLSILRFHDSDKKDWYYSLLLDGMIGLFFVIYTVIIYIINFII